MLANPQFICEHFDSSVDAGSRYYHGVDKTHFSERIYDLNATSLNNKVVQPIVDEKCIGENPGNKLNRCKFNGYLSYDNICNPCGVKEFQEECEELCEMTTGPIYGPYLTA